MPAQRISMFGGSGGCSDGNLLRNSNRADHKAFAHQPHPGGMYGPLILSACSPKAGRLGRASSSELKLPPPSESLGEDFAEDLLRGRDAAGEPSGEQTMIGACTCAR